MCFSSTRGGPGIERGAPHVLISCPQFLICAELLNALVRRPCPRPPSKSSGQSETTPAMPRCRMPKWKCVPARAARSTCPLTKGGGAPTGARQKPRLSRPSTGFWVGGRGPGSGHLRPPVVRPTCRWTCYVRSRRRQQDAFMNEPKRQHYVHSR